ncbi:MAG TPA: sterol desaturase family protein [Ferruginibacter sp.]|nr:sterol desaturase family protein [Ferruginibacter sp.]
MAHQKFFAYAVPLFLFFIALEYIYTKKKGKNYFQFTETVANLNVGIAERLLDVFTIVPFYYFFDYIYSHYALFHFKIGIAAYICLFLLTDLVWYWYHRLAHEVNIFWAVHIVHHQSDDFNYTVSARITVFQSVVRCLFWAALPLMGFPPSLIAVFLLIHGIYPFFTHTQAIEKLGWLEYIIVTPSHHRVHHSSNPEYLDKNYGDMLIIWDKIFGTFVEEDAAPSYGLTKPLNSHSFLWQHFHYILELSLAFRSAEGFQAKMEVLFGRPEVIDPRYRLYLEKKLLNIKPSVPTTSVMRLYISSQTTASLVLLFCLIYWIDGLSFIQTFLLSTFIIVSLINSGAIMEQRNWIFYLEYFRMIILLTGVWLYFPNMLTGIAILMFLLTLVYFFRPIRKKYFELMYHTALG